MRNRTLATAALVLAAAPAWAQSPADVTGPRMLTPLLVACTDVPTQAIPSPRLVIKGVHSAENRSITAAGGEVMIGRFADDGLAPGQRFVVRRLQGNPKDFPRPEEGFGAIRTAGWVTVTAVNEWNARATVDYACDGIRAGDYLEAYTPPTLPASATEMLKPDFSERASILRGADTREMFGDGDVFNFDRGTAHGVTTGMRFAVYRDHRDGLMPLVYIADAVVVEPGETTSKAVVVKAVDAAIVGDSVIPRRQPQ
jgi:hypothetical protein